MATFALSSFPTVPMTVVPNDFAHWQADPAGCGVEEDSVAFADLVDLADEILHGQTFEHHRCGLLV